MSATARFLSGLAVLVAPLLVSPAVHAFDRPVLAPERAGGLWVIDEDLAPAGRGYGIGMRKVWRVCLDRKADLALRELELREDRARAAADGLRCGEPVYALAGASVAATMQCRGASPVRGADVAVSLIRTTQTVSSLEMRSETVVRKNGEERRRMVAMMRRTGPCPDSMEPGARLLQHWRANGEETLKGQIRANIFSQRDELRRREGRDSR